MTECTYPIRFTYKRLCDTCKILTDCQTTIFEPGKIFYSGACGHFWDINGKSLDVGGWLSRNRDFHIPGK